MSIWTRIFGAVFFPPSDNGDRAVFVPGALMLRIRAAAEADGIGPVHWVHRALESALNNQEVA